jgi:hypothetical protein
MREVGEVDTKIRFTAERAPCGKYRDGLRHREHDDHGLTINDVTYDCGCRRLHHEFHDGSCRITTVRHDGRVLSDEHSSPRDG